MQPVEGSVSYLTIFRRHLGIVALACVIGIAAGWLTTPSQSEQSVVGATFTATNILVLEEDTTPTGDTPLTLSEVAARARAGEVPKRVATQLGGNQDPVALARRITADTDDEFGTLSISVTDQSASRATELANSFADELVTVLNERARARHDAAIAATAKQLAKLKAQVEDVSARQGTSRNDLLTAERDALVGRYAAAYIESQEQAETPTPTAGILTLQTATPVRDEATGISVPRNPVGRGAIGGAVGLVLGLGLALLAERVDTRLRSKTSVEAVFGFPVIAEIPNGPRRQHQSVAVVGAGRDSLYAESFRQLRTSLVSRSSLLAAAHAMTPAAGEPPGPEPATVVRGRKVQPGLRDRLRIAPGQPGAGQYSDVEAAKALEGRQGHPPPPALNGQASRSPRTVLVTSAGPREGKTTVAANLAAIFAESARSVVVLDCDFRHPSVHRMFQLPDGTGGGGEAGPGGESRPSGAPAEGAGLATLAKETSVPGVRIVQVSASGDFLGMARSLLAEARQQADIVVIDTPPLLMTSVAGALVADVDGVLVVARAGTTTGPAATEAGERLALLEAPVFGVVLVNALPDRSARRYYRAASGGAPSGDGRTRRVRGQKAAVTPPAPAHQAHAQSPTETSS